MRKDPLNFEGSLYIRDINVLSVMYIADSFSSFSAVVLQSFTPTGKKNFEILIFQRNTQKYSWKKRYSQDLLQKRNGEVGGGTEETKLAMCW